MKTASSHLGEPLNKSDIWRGVVLAVLAALLWCAVMNRWSAPSWQTPLEYTENPLKSDVLSYFAGIKAAADNHYWPGLLKTVPSLGAPYGAQWNDFPATEQFLIFIPGVLAKFIGVFAAANFMTMMAHVLAAGGMYAACRLLRVAWTWAFAMGLVYGFAQYAFAQGEHHLGVMNYWHVPLCLIVCRWITVGDGLPLRGRRWKFALAVGFVTGTLNIYYTSMFLQLAALGGLVQWIQKKDWRAALPAASVCAAVVAALALMNAHFVLFQLLNGPNTGAVVRDYRWMEYYALKIVDLFMPFPGHRFFSGLAQQYFSQVMIPGEKPPPSYLGVVGIAGVLFLAVVTFVRLVKNARSPMPLEAAQMLWVVLFSTVAGLNGLVGVLGFQFFRAGTRYSIFILALALMFLARRLSAWTKSEPAGAVAAAMVALVAIWDQTPPFTTGAQIEYVAKAVASDKAFTEQIETRLPQGAMVFQLPIVSFPERPVPGVSGYDHFRPYLFSKHLRYAFGSIKGRPRDDWPDDLRGLSLSQTVDMLERCGFAALYVNRAGFQDRGDHLFKSLQEMGRGEIVQSPARDLFFAVLRPSPVPALPTRRTDVR